MSDTHVVYMTQENCEFTVIHLESYRKTHSIQIPAVNLDNMVILEKPFTMTAAPSMAT